MLIDSDNKFKSLSIDKCRYEIPRTEHTSAMQQQAYYAELTTQCHGLLPVLLLPHTRVQWNRKICQTLSRL